MKKNFRKFFIIGVVVLAFVSYFSFNNYVHSSTTDNVSGFAWNGDTSLGGAGWLSFNCVSDGSCGSYGINRHSDGYLYGYVWSSNYGWLSFGGLSGFPSVAGATPDNAKADLSSGNVTGWARFCSVFVSGCLGSLLPTSTTGGWDGWVNLNGVKVDPISGNFSGYAWGGGDVIGWIDFSKVKIDVSNTCKDSNATNQGQPLPCTYPPNTCINADANNYGQPLPCTFDPNKECTDSGATNYNQPGACTYPPGHGKTPGYIER
jgi:hypothetical protein